MHPHETYQLCKKYKHEYVRINMNDGKYYDGFIDHIDHDHVGLAMPYEMEEDTGESYSPVRRRFGFRRRFFPLAGIAALSLLPFIGGGYPYYPYSPYGYGYGGSSFY